MKINSVTAAKMKALVVIERSIMGYLGLHIGLEAGIFSPLSTRIIKKHTENIKYMSFC
jgi:hypothetical protein